jgi:hypothetical protein
MIVPIGLTNDDDPQGGPRLQREGGVYNVAFAVHDDNITTRGHHVSFLHSESAPRPILRLSNFLDPSAHGQEHGRDHHPSLRAKLRTDTQREVASVA